MLSIPFVQGQETLLLASELSLIDTHLNEVRKDLYSKPLGFLIIFADERFNLHEKSSNLPPLSDEVKWQLYFAASSYYNLHEVNLNYFSVDHLSQNDLITLYEILFEFHKQTGERILEVHLYKIEQKFFSLCIDQETALALRNDLVELNNPNFNKIVKAIIFSIAHQDIEWFSKFCGHLNVWFYQDYDSIKHLDKVSAIRQAEFNFNHFIQNCKLSALDGISFSQEFYAFAKIMEQLTLWNKEITSSIETQNRKTASERIIDCYFKKSEFLALDHLSLTSLPNCLAMLSHLKKIDLSHNQLQKLPIDIRNLPSTCFIDAQNNCLIPFYLSSFQKNSQDISLNRILDNTENDESSLLSQGIDPYFAQTLVEIGPCIRTTLFAQPKNLRDLNNNLLKILSTRGALLGEKGEVLWDSMFGTISELFFPTLTSSEATIAVIESVYDNLLQTNPHPTYLELLQLKSLLRTVSCYIQFQNFDVTLNSKEFHPAMRSLIQKIDLAYESIPLNSDRCSPVKKQIQQAIQYYKIKDRKDLINQQELTNIQAYLSFLVLNEKLSEHLGMHFLFETRNLKMQVILYSGCHFPKNESGEMLFWKSDLQTKKIRNLSSQQRIQLISNLSNSNFGSSLVLSSIVNYISRYEKIEKPSLYFPQAYEYSKCIAEILINNQLDPVTREYLEHYYYKFFTPLETVDLGYKKSQHLLNDSIIEFTVPHELMFQKVKWDPVVSEVSLVAMHRKSTLEKGRKLRFFYDQEKKQEALSSAIVDEKNSYAPDQKKIEQLTDEHKKLSYVIEKIDYFSAIFNVFPPVYEEFLFNQSASEELYKILYPILYKEGSPVSETKQLIPFRRPTYALKTDSAFPPTLRRPVVEENSQPVPIKKDNNMISKAEKPKKQQQPSAQNNKTNPQKQVTANNPKNEPSSSTYEEKTIEKKKIIESSKKPQKAQIPETPVLAPTPSLSSPPKTANSSSLVYDPRVSIYFTDPKAALLNPKYDNIQNMPKVQEKVIVFHSFAKVVDDFLDSHGLDSTWEGSSTKGLKHISIPCEIEINGFVYRGILCYCFDEHGVLFHRCFSEKQPDELIGEIVRQGFWNVDFPPLEGPSKNKDKVDQRINLEDGSYVSKKINDFTIEIIDPKNKAKIRIFKIVQAKD